MAYNVTRRTGELGIRMALGARPRDVSWPILREALVLTGIGVAAGMPLAIALTCLVHRFFYGVAAHDPVTIIAAVGVLLGVAVLAALIPARRAAKIDPMEALRYE
jgi:ABC-type antimicrobial peptide transport system permease subunit